MIDTKKSHILIVIAAAGVFLIGIAACQGLLTHRVADAGAEESGSVAGHPNESPAAAAYYPNATTGQEGKAFTHDPGTPTIVSILPGWEMSPNGTLQPWPNGGMPQNNSQAGYGYMPGYVVYMNASAMPENWSNATKNWTWTWPNMTGNMTTAVITIVPPPDSPAATFVR